MLRSYSRSTSAFFLAWLILSSSAAWAIDVTETSTVTAATIFTDRALITRTARLHIPAGDSTLVITNLPNGFDANTLRAQGKASVAVSIGTVDVKNVFLKESANQVERDKIAALQAKIDERDYIKATLTTLTARESFIQRLINEGAEDHAANSAAKIDFSPEKWVKAIDTISAQMGTVQNAKVAESVKLRKVDEEITRLQAELAQIRSTGNQQRRDARIAVTSAAETDIALTLTYQTTGANWRPLYDARLDTASSQLTLEQYGQVTQQTGEDWRDVALTLSTAHAAIGSEMPTINEWFVRIARPVIQSMASFGSVGGGAPPMAMMKTAQAPMLADSMNAQSVQEDGMASAEVDAEQDDADVASTDYAAEFKVPATVNVPSTRDTSKVFVSRVSSKVDLSAQTTPSLSANAYLFADMNNTADYPLISGSVAKYRDGMFIGNAHLPLLRPQERENLSFGVDDRIKVTYKQIAQKKDNPTLIVVGDSHIERSMRTTITNLHKAPIMIKVFDRYPVADDADVKVKILESTTEGYQADTEGRQGVIVWASPIAASEEKTFTLTFRVDYPKGKGLIGLE